VSKKGNEVPLRGFFKGRIGAVGWPVRYVNRRDNFLAFA
jgi:hypothetical protein